MGLWDWMLAPCDVPAASAKDMFVLVNTIKAILIANNLTTDDDWDDLVRNFTDIYSQRGQ